MSDFPAQKAQLSAARDSGAAQQEYWVIADIQEISAEDKKLFSTVASALNQAGKSLVTGQELI